MSWLESFKESDFLNLVNAILNNSLICANQFNTEIARKFGKDTNEYYYRQMLAYYEFIFFYTHLVVRYTFVNYSHEKVTKLQEKLGPIIVYTTTETSFGHWPQHLKEGISKSFYENINKAEIDYSECKGLYDENNPLSENNLFPRLGRNVARLIGDESDKETIVKCLTISMKRYTEMDLERLVDILFR